LLLIALASLACAATAALASRWSLPQLRSKLEDPLAFRNSRCAVAVLARGFGLSVEALFLGGNFIIALRRPSICAEKYEQAEKQQTSSTTVKDCGHPHGL